MDEQTIDTRGRGLGRRTVVRAAVVTAWTAPLVQVVAAPTAAAVSGGTPVPTPADISGTTGAVQFTPQKSDNVNFTVTATIKNTGGSATDALTATLSWTPTSPQSGTLETPSPPSGWTPGSSAQNWNAGTPVPANGTQPFSLTGTIKKSGNTPVAGLLKVTFAASGKTAVVSGSWPPPA